MNFKWGAIAAGFGFVLSLLIGLIGGAGVIALVRALVIGAVFFALALGVYVVISRFLTELLDVVPGRAPPDGPGSQVDISVGEDDEPPPLFGIPPGGDADAGEAPAGFEQLDAFPEDSDVPPAEISDIPSAALDQIGEDRYTEKESVEGDLAEALQSKADLHTEGPQPADVSSAAKASADGAPEDALPDLEAMSRAFLASARESSGEGAAGSSDVPSAAGKSGEYSLSVSGKGGGSSARTPYMGGNKPVELEGDFKPKDIAQAIQTILKRD